ncbi:hypothetical protein Tco_0555835 [Tanacetum coccineum]
MSLVIDQTGQGEGSAIPVGSQYTPLMAPSTEPHPDTSAQSPITEPHTSSPQLTKPPTSSTIRETIRQEVEIPQSNFPTQTPVAYEATFTGVDVVHGGAATTDSSIDAGQGSGNITKSPTMPHDSTLPGGHTPGSDEGSMTLHELTILCINLTNKVESLEIELKQTKKPMVLLLINLSKEIHFKQGRSKIEEMDRMLEFHWLYLHNVEDSYGDQLKSAATAKASLKWIKLTERQRMAQVHQAAQGFTYAEWDAILARVAADEDFVQ